MSSEYMTSGQLLFLMFVIGLVLFSLVAGRWPFVEFWRWLKGSRTIYYIDLFGNVRSCSDSLSCALDWTRDSMIKISCGPFRRRSAIYGPASKAWKIVRGKAWPEEGQETPARIYLEDREGLSEGIALETVNAYAGLQALLNRIAKLEIEHKSDLEKLRKVNTAIVALFDKIISDKQRYRGVVALELRRDLQAVITETNVPAVSFEDEFLRVWEDLFQKNRLQVGRVVS